MAKPSTVVVYDHPSNVGGTHTVSIVRAVSDEIVEVRVWYGRPSPTGWVPWRDWDGYLFQARIADLSNKRIMPLFRDH